MCGFIVIAGPDRASVTHRALGRLRLRGPDGMGFFAGQYATVLHARLGIIKPGDDGLQPIRRLGDVLAFNGEIYNWQKLREPNEHTDSEVLLRKYQAFGTDAFRQFMGFWAAAIVHDSARNATVTLVRDQLGIRPLYYHVDGKNLIAASSIRAIYNLLPEKPSLNTEAMSEWARYQMVFGSKTFFRSIRRVLPGEAVIFQDGNLHHLAYENIWDTGDRVPDETWVEEAQELLTDCVNEATVADVPFASTCSGGLDSSVVTRLSSPGLAYHSNYAGKDFNETAFAKVVVEGTATKLFVHNAREGTDISVVDRMRDIVQDQDDLSVGSVVLPLDELMAEIKRRYRVVMLGTGGDELFGGYVRLDAALGRMQDPGYAATYDKLRALNLSVGGRYEHLHRKGAEHMFKFFDLNAATQGFAGALQWDPSHAAESMLHFERTQFLPALLTIDDRIAGRHGVEGRPALLHQKFVRHVAQLAPEAILEKPLKYVAREVFAPWLPVSVLQRTDKKGFPTPIGAMMSENSAQVREYVTSYKRQELFSIDNIRWTTEDPYDRGLFGLLQLVLWLESFDA